VSAVGAEVDRMEHEMVRLVPGTRYVDLETDRGKPVRPPSPGTLLAMQQQQQQLAAAGAAGARALVADPGADSDHLADLVYYPLGSLTSVDSLDDSHSGAWGAPMGGPTRGEAQPPTSGEGGGTGGSGGGGGGGGGGSASEASSGTTVLK
jgi:hypothetical protein